MFILHIDSGEEMRGGQWQALYLLRGLARAGHRVRLLAPHDSPLRKAALADSLDTGPLRITALPGSIGGVDLIHAHDARAHTLAVALAKPVVVSRRVAFPVRRGIASRWKYARAAHYIAVSHYVKQTLIDASLPPDRISVVYDGVPLGPVPSPLENRTLVVALDSTDPGKGKAIVQQASTLAHIAVHFSKNLIQDLPRAAAFVYITELEGLGSAALLAMAAGAPVVASRVGGLPEIVEDGVTGLLTSNHPADVAAAIRRLSADRQQAARLAAAARARVEKEFTRERMVVETVRIYERILSC